MMIWTKRAPILVLALFALASCDNSMDPPPYRYRLKAEVQTPEGVRIGSSITEVQWYPHGIGSASYRIKGQAVTVDLPGKQTLFILMGRDGSEDWPAYVYPYPAAQNSADAEISDQEEAPYQPVPADYVEYPLPRKVKVPWGEAENYPYFVRFRDIKDPKSIEEVDPDDLAKSFGPGFSLKSLTIQLTKDPPTLDIQTKFPFLGDPHLLFGEQSRDPKTGFAVPRKIHTIADNVNIFYFWRER